MPRIAPDPPTTSVVSLSKQQKVRLLEGLRIDNEVPT